MTQIDLTRDRSAAAYLSAHLSRIDAWRQRLAWINRLGLVLALGVVDAKGGTIEDSYSRAAVSGSSHLGGLVGSLVGGSVERAYSTGLVSGAGTAIGGLLGENDSGSVGSSFWDTQTSRQPTSAGAPTATPTWVG